MILSLKILKSVPKPVSIRSSFESYRASGDSEERMDGQTDAIAKTFFIQVVLKLRNPLKN